MKSPIKWTEESAYKRQTVWNNYAIARIGELVWLLQTHKVEVEYIIAVQGLKRTIACMDEEHPRTEASINNRSHLRQILNMEDLYRKNKVGRVGKCRLWWKWTTKIMCVADFSDIAGSELPPKNSTGDYCKLSHHECSGWQSQQQ